MLIIRRSKLEFTASGIIKPIGGRLVHRLREDSSLNLCTRRPPIRVMIPEAVNSNFDLLMMSTSARNI